MLHQEEIQIPLLERAMTHGTLRRWLVNSGDWVEIAQPIFELETNETIFEIESFDRGTITTIGSEGEIYEVGAKVGYIEFTEEERIDFERISVRLTHEMRLMIDGQRGDQNRSDWLRESFSEFIAAKSIKRTSQSRQSDTR